ncbi:MAG TPA: hypothetical protein VF779_17015 [Pyrinomonadaceae bacterium]
MSITGNYPDQANAADKTRRTVFIVAGLVAVLLIVGLVFYLKTRPEPQQATAPADQKLEGGFRAGSPEFEKYKEFIQLDKPEAEEQDTIAGGTQMTLATTVRNFSGQTISGLEVKGAVVDLQNKPIKDRTMIVIPSAGLTELENNKTARIKVIISGFKKEDVRANIKMEITAVKLK